MYSLPNVIQNFLFVFDLFDYFCRANFIQTVVFRIIKHFSPKRPINVIVIIGFRFVTIVNPVCTFLS